MITDAPRLTNSSSPGKTRSPRRHDGGFCITARLKGLRQACKRHSPRPAGLKAAWQQRLIHNGHELGGKGLLAPGKGGAGCCLKRGIRPGSTL